jgi:hypothetical protein
MAQAIFHAVTLGLLATGLAPAPEGILAPQGPPPKGAVAKVVGDSLEITESLVEYRQEARTEQVLVNGQLVARMVNVTVPVYKLIKKAVPLTAVQGHGTDGRPIDPKRLRELLASEHAVLVSADGRPLDAFYRNMLKDGTLILVIGPAIAPAPPPPLR